MACSRFFGRREWLKTAGTALAVTVAAAFVFYDSPWGMCTAAGLVPAVWKIRYDTAEKAYHRHLGVEFRDYLLAAASAFIAGYPAEAAFCRALEELKGIYGETSILCAEWGDLPVHIEMKEPVEQVLLTYAYNSGNEDIKSFAEIFGYAKRGGGDFLRIIQTAAETICEKMEVQEEVTTIMAQKALEQKVMCVVPFGILLFFKVASPEFIRMLYGNPTGVCIMTAALLLYAAAYWMGIKIMDIRV